MGMAIRQLLVLGGILGILAVPSLRADELRHARTVLIEGVKLIEKVHLSGRRLDDAMSAKWFDTFLADVDPRRIYLLQGDVDRLSKHRTELDDAARAGQLNFVREVTEIIQNRVEEATKIAVDEVGREHDFRADETAELQYVTYAATPEELRERWRKLMKLTLLRDRIEGIPHNTTIWRTMQWIEVKRRQSFSLEEMTTLYLDSLARTYDPHSRYFGRQDIEAMMIRQ